MPVAQKRVLVGFNELQITADEDYGKHLGERFEPQTAALLAALCEPGANVLDIGANIGVTALLFSALTPTGSVTAIEPVSAAFQLLQSNVRDTGASNVRMHNFALGAENGTVRMQGYRENLSGSFVADRHTIELESHFTEEVPVRRLDEVFGDMGIERLDLVKIDVEGFELEVLAGAQQTLAKHRPVVMLEMNHVTLNLWRRITLPEFRERLLSIFPYVYAVQDAEWLDFRDSTSSHLIQFRHLFEWKYLDLVAGFDAEEIERRLQRIAEMRQRLDRVAEARLAPVSQPQPPAPDSLVEEVRRLSDELEISRRRVAGLEASTSALVEEVRRLSDELEISRRRVADLEASTSWRITAPLRAVRRFLPSRLTR